MNAQQQLIVALDVPTFEEAKHLVETLDQQVHIYKIGFQLFTAYGPFIVRYLLAKGKNVFLDLKFHDIPNTVASGVASAVGLSVEVASHIEQADQTSRAYGSLLMMTVHTQGGVEMMKAAKQAAQQQAALLGVRCPWIIGVTVLTSDAAFGNISDLVLERALLAKQAGLDGVVASAQEASNLRQKMGKDFLIITPGIRPTGIEAGDQKRVETPLSAMKNGSSFLVVGRPIVKAQDPKQAVLSILHEMQQA